MKAYSFIQSIFSILDSSAKKISLKLSILYIARAIIDIFGISLIIPLLSILLYPDKALDVPILQYVGNSPPEIIANLARAALIIFFVRAFLTLYIARSTSSNLQFLRHQLTTKLFKKYLNIEQSKYAKLNTPELIHNIHGHTIHLINYVLDPLLSIVSDAILCVFFTVSLVLLYPTITVLLFSASAVFIILYIKVFKRKFKLLGIATSETSVQMLTIITNGLSLLKEVKILNLSGFFSSHFEKASDRYTSHSIQHSIFSILPKTTLEFLGISMILLAVLISNDGTSGNTKTIQMLMTISIVIIRVSPLLSNILSKLSLIRTHFISYEIISSFFKDEFHTGSHPPLMFTHSSSDEQVIFKDVTYGYTSEKKILNTVSLAINKGDKVGLIGHSGSGKTTFLYLTLGLLRPTSGRIQFLSNKNKEVRFSYIPQDVFLMNTSVKENIALGVPTDSIDVDKVKNCLKMTKLNQLLTTESIISENGRNLSGGQRQRVGIARALYSNYDILILDEATSSLDAETESIIIDEMYRLFNDKTILFVSHKLSALKMCNKIYEVSNGKITLQNEQ